MGSGTPFTLEEIGLHILRMRDQNDRIEAKLDILIAAIADDEDEQGPTHDLDGAPLPAERDQTQEL